MNEPPLSGVRETTSMKRALMVFSALAAFGVPAAAPLSVLAQDRGETARPDRGPRGEGRRAGGPASRPDRPRMERPQVRPDQPRPDQPRPERPQRPSQPSRPDGEAPDRPRPDAGRPNRPDGQRPDRPSRPDGERPQRPGSPGVERPRPERPGAERPSRPGGDARPNRPDRNDGWNRPDRPDGGWNRDRDRDHREFRQRFSREQWLRDWNRRHARTDWWRNDRAFRGWSGVRIGFYFAPGYGYYNVPRSYWGRRFHEGELLPSIFWRYEIRDFDRWGLPWPPAGTMWVFVDNSIYLVDRYDGYVIEAIHDAWRW